MDSEVEHNEDYTRTSFLDVITCAMGAAILLMLSFSVIKRQQPPLRSAPVFIHTIWTVTGGVDGFLSFEVKSPDGQTYELSTYDFDRWGKPNPGLSLDDISFSTVGFDRNRKGDKDDNGNLTFELIIMNPTIGEWFIEALYAATGKDNLDFLMNDSDEEIHVTRLLLTRNHSRVTEKHLKIGDVSDFGSITADLIQ